MNDADLESNSLDIPFDFSSLSGVWDSITGGFSDLFTGASEALQTFQAAIQGIDQYDYSSIDSSLGSLLSGLSKDLMYAAIIAGIILIFFLYNIFKRDFG
jgi:hypothetical protein